MSPPPSISAADASKPVYEALITCERIRIAAGNIVLITAKATLREMRKTIWTNLVR
jgi:hypothetical protein